MEPSRGQAAQKTKVLLPLLLVLLLSSPERFDALPKTTQRELPVSVPSSAALATRSCFTPSAPKGVPGGTRGPCSRTEPPMAPGPETRRKPQFPLPRVQTLTCWKHLEEHNWVSIQKPLLNPMSPASRAVPWATSASYMQPGGTATASCGQRRAERLGARAQAAECELIS